VNKAINYLTACPLREAERQPAVLSQLDAEAARRAKVFAQQKSDRPDGA
jgi:hypothetical protein